VGAVGGMLWHVQGEGWRQIGSRLCGNDERIGSELWGRRLENWVEPLDGGGSGSNVNVCGKAGRR
jgi:hypothetical protein